MIIGIPKEIKNHEYRVGLTPESVAELIADGHRIIVESNAGAGIGADDSDYESRGAEIETRVSEIFARADMIVKVKEPQASERAMLRADQILFTYLHLAADRDQTQDLLKSGAIAIAYETITDDDGALPLLRPMSQVAGRLSVQEGAWALKRNSGGRGVLLGGVPGVAPARVVIIGGGDVGFNAAQMAVGLHADVTILERDPTVIARLSDYFGVSAKVLQSTPELLLELLKTADLIIGAVLIPGAAAPKLITRNMLQFLRTGAVLVDVAIDQGGCFETSRPTTHESPTYEVDGVVHYCVANMPGAVARTSTYALNAATMPFVRTLAKSDWRAALAHDVHLRRGLNVCRGQLTNAAVGKALGLEFTDPEDALAGAAGAA